MSVQAIRKQAMQFRMLERAFFCLRDFPSPDDTNSLRATFVTSWVGQIERDVRAIFAAAKAKVEGKTPASEFKGFVNYVLTEDDKAGYNAWGLDDHDLWLLLTADIQAGYKFSCSYNKQNDTFSATYMCNDALSPNAGYCLSAFAPDWYNAVKSLIYKHNEVLGGLWNLEKAKEQARWG